MYYRRDAPTALDDDATLVEDRGEAVGRRHREEGARLRVVAEDGGVVLLPEILGKRRVQKT